MSYNGELQTSIDILDYIYTHILLAEPYFE